MHDEIKAEEYLIIQFGRNDQKVDRPDIHADPHGAYKGNLRCFLQGARDKGAIPILATPLARRRFDKHGQFRDNMGDYPVATRDLAQEEETPLIDLHRDSQALLSSFGPEASKALVWWVEPGADPSLPLGRQDNSHLSEEGAKRVCQFAAAALRNLDIGLAKYLRDLDDGPSVTE